MLPLEHIYFIAGENSGDLIGSKIISGIKSLLPNIICSGVGGKKMLEAGLNDSLFPMSNISIIGFFEVIPHILKIKKLIKKTVEDIFIKNPDIIITIDAQEFSFRVAKQIAKLNPQIKLLHIVAPSVWLYRPNRASKYAKIFDHLICLLPFEPILFERHGLLSTYVGHFLFDGINISTWGIFRKKYDISSKTKLICVTPGSRKKEIQTHLPIFLAAISLLQTKYKNIVCAIAVSDSQYLKLIQNISSKFDFKILNIDKIEHPFLYKDSDVAIAKSGTNTLEIAAAETPLIVAYKINPLSWLYLKKIVTLKYACLINIISNQEIIKELLQKNCNSQQIAHDIDQLLANPNLAKLQIKLSKQILNKMGFRNNEINPIKSTIEVIMRLKKV